MFLVFVSSSYPLDVPQLQGYVNDYANMISPSVKAQLAAMGIDGSRLSTKGFGASKPIAGNDTPEGKANNRRVEFVKQ